MTRVTPPGVAVASFSGEAFRAREEGYGPVMMTPALLQEPPCGQVGPELAQEGLRRVGDTMLPPTTSW
jgi:hypothetical protein